MTIAPPKTKYAIAPSESKQATAYIHAAHMHNSMVVYILHAQSGIG